ncbi:hypothetical protein [Cellulomonas fimi]|uniref:Uncharacterized protein n=1 Tax=Cellulomonas fimi TaxID=1708 RepID=A0A7Y0QGR4_CELFI|nr:hypothetical protein [Cellulomonas fimi]NMR20386.1 hypothetical protein [Cellulomonas fimi]
MTTTHLDDAVIDVTPQPVPCAARPWTDFVHLDGSCACFYGGPAPLFSVPQQRASSGV